MADLTTAIEFLRKSAEDARFDVTKLGEQADKEEAMAQFYRARAAEKTAIAEEYESAILKLSQP